MKRAVTTALILIGLWTAWFLFASSRVKADTAILEPAQITHIGSTAIYKFTDDGCEVYVAVNANSPFQPAGIATGRGCK